MSPVLPQEQYEKNPLYLKPGETPEQYSARAAKLQESKPGSDTTDPGSLTGTMPEPGGMPTGSMSNLRLALRSALGEATQRRATKNITALSPMLEGGAAPNVITAAIGLAQNGLRQNQDTMFKDIMEGVKEEKEALQTKFNNGLNYLKTIDSVGALGKMDDAGLLGMSEQFGLDLNTLMRARQAAKENDDLAKAKILKDLQGKKDPTNDPMSVSDINSFSNAYGFTPPPGLSFKQVTDLMNLQDPPSWFVNQAQEEKQQSLLPSIIKRFWQEAKDKLEVYKKKSSNLSNSDIPSGWTQ